MTEPVDSPDIPHTGHDLSHVVVKYVLPYNTLLAISAGIATLAGFISPWLLAGFALSLQVLLVVALMLDGAFRHELVQIGRKGATQNRRSGHFIRFLWPSEHARIYKTGPFWALLLITTGISIYATHQWQEEIKHIAAKKASMHAKRGELKTPEGIAVGNPTLNIPGSTAHIRAGTIVRREEYGVLRFVVADALVGDSVVGDAFLKSLIDVKSAEVQAEIDCETGGRIRELSVTSYPSPNWAGQARQTVAAEIFWRDISKETGAQGKFDREIERIVCAFHRPGEPMDDN